MALTLTKIFKGTAQVSLNYGDDTLTVNYYPNKITEKTFADLQSFASMSDTKNITAGFSSLNDVLSTLIKSWDLYVDDANQEMYPLDADHLAELPIVLRSQVLQAIMEDVRPEQIAPQMTES